MRANPLIVISLFIIVILFIDFYAYIGLRRITDRLKKKLSKTILIIHWIIPAVTISGLIFIFGFRGSIPAAEQIIYVHFFSGFFFLFYIPKIVFLLFKLIEDLIRVSAKITSKAVTKNEQLNEKLNKISRAKFLSRIGIITAGIPFVSILYGIGIGRFNFTVRKVPLIFKNLPSAFNGIKILQISDFHLGGFINNKHQVEEAVDLINDQQADIILFTGDFVNNVSSEMDEFVTILSRIKAPMGKYSILGNHDYGDYVQWNSEQEKEDNLNRLISLQNKTGFKLLRNENELLKIDNEEISLIGVENWGLPPFPQYGNLNEALSGVTQNQFKILMSHDPTHWDQQVLGKTNIDLTLSGHTHGAQFGIEIPGWRWSPVNLRYKHWGGLYQEAEQYLYVNTGIGFIGFPGRIGMPPEITVFTINRGIA